MINQYKYINGLNAHFENLFSECERKIENLSKGQLNFKIAEEKWTIAQILDHLIIVNKSYIARSEIVLKNLNTRNFNEPIKFKSEYYGNMVINLISAESKIKTKTIEDFKPPFDVYDINVKEEFCSTLKDIKKFINKLGDFDINEGKVKFVKDNFIDVNLGDVAKIVLVHIERHFDQIDVIIENDNFPNF